MGEFNECKCHECGLADDCVFAYSTASGSCESFRTPGEVETERRVSAAHFRGFVWGLGFAVLAYVAAALVLRHLGWAV